MSRKKLDELVKRCGDTELNFSGMNELSSHSDLADDSLAPVQRLLAIVQQTSSEESKHTIEKLDALADYLDHMQGFHL